MGCTFCATGTMGLQGHLNAGEILEQLVHANRLAGTRIRNVVFMGMGEPLHNYEAVLASVKVMTKSEFFSLRQDRVTVSTVGIPNMARLVRDAPYVALALSLHAPNQKLREQIVPVAKSFKLEALMEAVDDYLGVGKGRRMMIEYIMIKGVNDQDEHAHELGRLLKNRNVQVNLIPYNPTDVPYDYETPSDERCIKFSQILILQYGMLTTLRKHQGRNADAACGQLALKTAQQDSKCGQGGGTDIEDLLRVRPKKVGPPNVTRLSKHTKSSSSPDTASHSSSISSSSHPPQSSSTFPLSGKCSSITGGCTSEANCCTGAYECNNCTLQVSTKPSSSSRLTCKKVVSPLYVAFAFSLVFLFYSIVTVYRNRMSGTLSIS